MLGREGSAVVAGVDEPGEAGEGEDVRTLAEGATPAVPAVPELVLVGVCRGAEHAGKDKAIAASPQISACPCDRKAMFEGDMLIPTLLMSAFSFIVGC